MRCEQAGSFTNLLHELNNEIKARFYSTWDLLPNHGYLDNKANRKQMQNVYQLIFLNTQAWLERFVFHNKIIFILIPLHLSCFFVSFFSFLTWIARSKMIHDNFPSTIPLWLCIKVFLKQKNKFKPQFTLSLSRYQFWSRIKKWII